jgi:hypothetical protein
MEGRGNLFLFFMARFQNFPILVIFGTAADFATLDPFFPGIDIFSSSWDCRRFYDVKPDFPGIGIFGSSWDCLQFLGQDQILWRDRF